MDVSLPQLRRVRWAVRFTLTLGVSASVAANVLHARPDPVDQIIAGWSPIALLLSIEVISRVPVSRLWLALIRWTGLAFVGGIAFWVSYWHMAAAASSHGETGGKYLLPFSVDGLVIVACVSLIELTGQIRAVEAVARQIPLATNSPPVTSPPLEDPMTAPAAGRCPGARPATASAGVAVLPEPAPCLAGGLSGMVGAAPLDVQPSWREPVAGVPAELPAPVEEELVEEPVPTGRSGTADPEPLSPVGQAPPYGDTAAAVAYWRLRDPTLQVPELADRVGRSPRTVRRILAQMATGDAPRGGANGSATPLADAVTSPGPPYDSGGQ